MALRDEQTDILGGPILQRPESGLLAAFSHYHLVFKLVTLVGFGLLVWIACVRGLEHLKKHRELRHKKAMRRKHGIPDSDCRPFAVAYAAAKRAHLEREAQDRKKAANYVSVHNPPAVDQRTHAEKDARVLRKRIPESTVRFREYHLPGKHDIVYDNKRRELHTLDFASRYNPSPLGSVVPEPSPVEWSSICRTNTKAPVIYVTDNQESRKRSFEDEGDAEHEIIKKSRIDADELMDGVEQADWYAQYSDGLSQRAFRVLPDRQPGSRPVYMDGQEKFQHIDDIHKAHEPDEVMEGVDEGKVTELKAMARGKKRDRAEAGSAFGGDDEDDIRNGRASHHRKRRTISRRKTDMPVRGQKRDRETEPPESEDEGVDTPVSEGHARRNSKKKRDKKAASVEVSEISVDDPRVLDPLCGGRRIGDEWDAEGVHYKVGGNGERLRLTLVKKARNKYHMPQDSQHPDRSAALEIYVEMWMTEEQYKEAELRHELAWPEPRESSGSRTPDVLGSPSKHGKNLLWDSVKCGPARRPFRQFVPPGSSIRTNPFEQWQSRPMSGRRVASSSTITSPLLPGVGPTRPSFRGFSKWEKQDREAEAMARIRAKIEEQKKAEAPEIPTSVTAPELGIKPSSVPTITVTPAVAEGKADGSAPPSKSTLSTFPIPSLPTTIEGTPRAAPATTHALSLSSTFIPPTTPSTLFPSLTPTVPTTTSIAGSLPPFSFSTLPQVQSSTSTAASSSTVPHIFGKGTGAGAPPSITPLPSTLGAATRLQPLATETTSKSAPFSSTKPDVSSSPATANSSIISEATPTLNATSSPPVTFGFTPAATMLETPAAPSVSASVTTSGSLKPIAPLFSFSVAPPSTSIATLTTSSAPSAPKFSFGQLSASAVPAIDESKSTVPVSLLGDGAGLNEAAKPSPVGITSTFGSSTFTSASATNLFGKPVVVDRRSSTLPPPKPTLVSADGNAGPSASSSSPLLSFDGADASSNSAGGSKPASSFEGVAGGSDAPHVFGSNPTKGKSTLTFGASADGPKLRSTFGDNIANSLKPSSAFGGSAGGAKSAFAISAAEAPRHAPVFSDTAEGSKPTFTFSSVSRVTEVPEPTSLFGGASNISMPSHSADPSKYTPTLGSTTSLPSTSSFAFGKDDTATSSTSTHTKPAVSFIFGAPSSATGSIFGQASTPAAGDDSAQTVFGKPTNTTPSAFGFPGTGSSTTFTFGKPVTQNQKQEQ